MPTGISKTPKAPKKTAEPVKVIETAQAPTILTLPYKFTPRDYQLDFYKAVDSGKYSRFFLRWCRRSGKDKTCFAIIPKILWQRVGACYYLFPTYAQGRKALWENIDGAGMPFLEHIPQELIKGINNNEMKITLKNNSIIRVMGTEDVDSLVGTNPILLIFSEWALQNLQAWEFLRPIVENNKGLVIFNSTPRGKNHMYDMEQHNAGNPEWYISEVQTLFPEAPNYYVMDPPFNHAKAQAEGMAPELIEQEYGVSYVAGAKGNYYADSVIAARNSGRIGNFPYDDHKYVDVHFDLGWSDDTTMGFKQIDGGRHIWIDYYENNTKDLKHYVEIIKEKNYSIRDVFVPHDAKQGKFQLGFSHAEVLQNLLSQAGISATVQVAPKPNTKQEAINAVRAVFSSYYFNEALCADLVTKVSLYHRKFDKNKDVYSEHPVHDWTSHAADMLTTDALTREMQGSELGTADLSSFQPEWSPLDD